MTYCFTNEERALDKSENINIDYKDVKKKKDLRIFGKLQIFGAATAAMPHHFRRAWLQVSLALLGRCLRQPLHFVLNVR